VSAETPLPPFSIHCGTPSGQVNPFFGFERLEERANTPHQSDERTFFAADPPSKARCSSRGACKTLQVLLRHRESYSTPLDAGTALQHRQVRASRRHRKVAGPEQPVKVSPWLLIAWETLSRARAALDVERGPASRNQASPPRPLASGRGSHAPRCVYECLNAPWGLAPCTGRPWVPSSLSGQAVARADIDLALSGQLRAWCSMVQHGAPMAVGAAAVGERQRSRNRISRARPLSDCSAPRKRS
jgi:hypothetical protein